MTFRELIEGTTATITVLAKGTYKTSFLQYDGDIKTSGKELIKNYNSPKQASTLVTNSGELRSIFELEYYTDRTLLEITKDEQKAVKNANESHIKYFYDGSDWYFQKGQIKYFSDMKLLKKAV